MSKITDTLREARLAAGMKQIELAKLLGITQAFMSDIERGRRELPVHHMQRLPEPIRTRVVKMAMAVKRAELKVIGEILNTPPTE